MVGVSHIEWLEIDSGPSAVRSIGGSRSTHRGYVALEESDGPAVRVTEATIEGQQTRLIKRGTSQEFSAATGAGGLGAIDEAVDGAVVGLGRSSGYEDCTAWTALEVEPSVAAAAEVAIVDELLTLRRLDALDDAVSLPTIVGFRALSQTLLSGFSSTLATQSRTHASSTSRPLSLLISVSDRSSLGAHRCLRRLTGRKMHANPRLPDLSLWAATGISSLLLVSARTRFDSPSVQRLAPCQVTISVGSVMTIR